MFYIQGLSQSLVARNLRDLDGRPIESPMTRSVGESLERRLTDAAARRCLADHSDRLLADMGLDRDQVSP